ncbi:ornithine cyclodeaminase [Muribaculum intestinale]|uniref:Ornithine cyclodeaminase n=1 Tax=Muribaculum intestinale TaxID=1796646 RepID=A0A1B1S8Q4_9BACT|nr:ornithine cyclodeaminase [Muribaculum intestinale]ANU63179.1 ornithine cyclodeaminase [Muribaculum intestinale]ASB38742.1 ornithine cyclodeaminase [Muribaculum intestinale]PWB04323.1 ornithine cyclodeaminase [Muribaculum intestinale]PWB11201.1 ornithine cyclodeaminase [Muribaculum intestinale]QQR09483.1 ornithine cyclodeaminase [Muribaculum intestinale]
MRYISSEAIANLNISPSTCVDWVREAFLMKNRCQLPPKISLHPQGNDFFNTMPCMLPSEYHTFGCKVVSRIKGSFPALKSEMMLFDSLSGEMTALMNCDWITAMRTGAVAALAINTLRKSDAKIYSIVGLGVIGHAVLDCILATNSDIVVRLMRYKDHAEKTIGQYSGYPNVAFEIADTMEHLVCDADVVISCITDADGLLVPDINLFKPGVLVVPVHTRGFQNCDTVFDKVFADDEGHVKGFKYFSQFREFGELGDVLSGRIAGRANDDERILSYNIGLGLHDVLYGHKILNLINV